MATPANFRLVIDEKFFYLSLQFPDNLKRLADVKSLHDVTLEASDGLHMTANKSVLAARSLFFEKVFEENPFKENVLFLCLDGLELTQMTRLIYGLEIQVKKTRLEKVLDNKDFLGIH